jgi:hypothetical protein
MKINQHISLISIVILLSSICPITKGFSDKTHKAISVNAITNSQADTYLKNQLGLTQGLGTSLSLDQGFVPAGERIPYAQFEARINPELPSNPCSILNYLKAGANLEDVPNPRARHHFLDPIRNAGLDNKTDHPNLSGSFDFWTNKIYGLHFDLTGASAENRALGIEGAGWNTEYLNYYNWPDTRIYFYRALTKPNLAGRNHYLALTFISLGQTVHLIEDMGVPAHTRNDFVYGHTMFMEINPNTWGKNPFEFWTEKQVIANNNNIPSSWLLSWTPQAKVFDKISKYWDTDLYTGQYVGTIPTSTWGLSEQTNYQFLSTSTVFGCIGALYQFPNPAISNTTLLSEKHGTQEQYFRYYQGYGVQHLARQSYTNFKAYGYGGNVAEISQTTITPDDDVNVYNDYVRITIPRTIDYASGLINYFFRGKLSVIASCTCAECSPTEFYITNQSVNTNVNQTLKGGSFELYWDDNTTGNRTQVTGLTVYDSNDPNITSLWSASTTLTKGSSVRARFNKPSSSNIAQYILVYSGTISANPSDPDLNDLNALAVCMFNPPGPSKPTITNITPPQMACPGSILLINGTGFSKIPSNNTALFQEANSVHSDVYGAVQAADSNGQWLKVQLPVFDASTVDYYPVNLTVTVDGNTSDPYAYKLSNYVWITISLWDAGTSLDDDFDLYVNNEYWLTAYAPSPEDPVTVEYGFWYEDVYCYVDMYLADSSAESGGTLGIEIYHWVDRVVAHRWNSSTQSQEFLYDENYLGYYEDYFGSDILRVINDGVELDVYALPSYSGPLSLTTTAPLTVLNQRATLGNGERQGQVGSVDTSIRSAKSDIPRKREIKGTVPHRTRTKNQSNNTK